MKYPKWLLGPVNQCAYIKAHGHNLYDKAGNPMLLSPRALNEAFEPLQPHEYSLASLPDSVLQEIHPDKAAGDILKLHIKTNNANTYYLSALKDRNLPIQSKDGHRVYQIFKDICLNIPCYDWYYQEKYKNPDSGTPGSACLYVAVDAQDNKQNRYGIPPVAAQIRLGSLRDRGIFQHRVQRHIKVPNNEPSIVNPLAPPLQIEYDDLDIWIWLNRLTYFFFSIPEALAKLTGAAACIAYNLAGKVLLQIPINLNRRFQDQLNLPIPADDAGRNKHRLIYIAQILLWAPMALLYITGNVLLSLGKITQMFCNLWASIFAIPTGYFRAGGFAERCDIANNQFYNLFVAAASLAVFAPKWIGDAICMKFDETHPQGKKNNLVAVFAARALFAISILTQGLLECTGGMADLESHHHELALHDSVVSRCASVSKIRIKGLFALIAATFRDIRSTLFPNEKAHLVRSTTEINKALEEQCHQPSVLQHLGQLEPALDTVTKHNDVANQTKIARQDGNTTDAKNQPASSASDTAAQHLKTQQEPSQPNTDVQGTQPSPQTNDPEREMQNNATQKNIATAIDNAKIATQNLSNHAEGVQYKTGV